MARPAKSTVHPAKHRLAHGRSRGGHEVRTHPTPSKLQGAKGFLRINGTDPPLEKQFHPRVQLLLEGASYGHL